MDQNESDYPVNESMELLHDAPKTPSPKRTFTILAIIVLIAIFGLIAGYLFNFFNSIHKDNLRKQDLTYISTKLQTYYNLNHYYPTLDQINSDGFVVVQPYGVDMNKLKDPSSKSSKLVGVASNTNYAYIAYPISCENKVTTCQHYKLVAVMENGGLYTLSSKN